MRECAKKPLTVALASVLVFMALFPVPVGARSLDRARFQEANANPAVAAPLIITTALAACGVYVAGYDMTAYANNQQTISGQFLQFCANNLYHDDIDAATAAIQSAVTPGGAVDMAALSSLGVLGLIPQFASNIVGDGTAVAGVNSSAGTGNCIYFGNTPWNTFSTGYGMEQVCAAVQAHSNPDVSGSQLIAYSQGANSDSVYYTYYFRKPGANINFNSGDNPSLTVFNYYTCPYVVYPDGREVVGSIVGRSSSSKIYRSNCLLYEGYEWAVNNGYTVTNGLVNSFAAVVNSQIAANTSAYPSTAVQPFEPTAEQLAAGYDVSAILEAINSNTGTIEGVAAQLGSIAGLLSPVAGIAANVQSIKDAWTTTMTAQATPFPWLNSLLSPITAGVQAVQSWIGDTPFPTIMQTVIDGVQAIPDGIRNVGDDILEGLGAIPGAIGTASDVIVGGLQGVLDASLGLAGDIADALGLDAIADALISPVQGILEAVQAANNPTYPTGSGVALSADAKAEFDAKLLEKAPFCYVKHAQVVGENVAANFGGAASFYVDFPFPMMQEPLRVDATPFFAESWGGFTIAQWIRMLLTSVLCAGFIVVAIKVAMRTVGTGAGD